MKLATPIAASLFAVFVGVPAFAAENTMEQAQKVLDSATTTMSQAVTAAEGKVGGKALSARLERSHGQDFYDVHVLKDQKLTDVHVSTMDSKILEEKPMKSHHAASSKSTPPASEQSPGKS